MTSLFNSLLKDWTRATLMVIPPTYISQDVDTATDAGTEIFIPVVFQVAGALAVLITRLISEPLP